MKFGGLLRVLGLNAVPIGGVVFGELAAAARDEDSVHGGAPGRPGAR